MPKKRAAARVPAAGAVMKQAARSPRQRTVQKPARYRIDSAGDGGADGGERCQHREEEPEESAATGEEMRIDPNLSLIHI